MPTEQRRPRIPSSVSFDHEILTRLDHYAAKVHTNRSAVVREALVLFLDARDHLVPPRLTRVHVHGVRP